MPKPSQNIETSEGSKRIDINYLFRNKLISNTGEKTGYLTWKNSFGSETGTISIKTNYSEKEKYLRLIYTKIDNYTTEKTDIDYTVQIVEIPSNLGKGFNYYFLCPFSNRKCKILYLAYGSLYFKSRFAYQNPIYYDCQKCSKRDYFLTRYFKFEDRLNKLNESGFRKSYNGKKTRNFKNYEYLNKQVETYDYLRWKVFESVLLKRRMLNKN